MKVKPGLPADCAGPQDQASFLIRVLFEDPVSPLRQGLNDVPFLKALLEHMANCMLSQPVPPESGQSGNSIQGRRVARHERNVNEPIDFAKGKVWTGLLPPLGPSLPFFGQIHDAAVLQHIYWCARLATELPRSPCYAAQSGFRRQPYVLEFFAIGLSARAPPALHRPLSAQEDRNGHRPQSVAKGDGGAARVREDRDTAPGRALKEDAES